MRKNFIILAALLALGCSVGGTEEPMAWPYDARSVNAGAGIPIPSALENEEQDRIVDLHRQRTVVFSKAVYGYTGGVADWQIGNPIGSDWAYICIVSTRIAFFFPLRNDTNSVRIYQARAKVYNVGAATMTGQLYTQDTKMSSATTAPSAPVAVAGASDAAAGGAGSYDTMIFTPAATPLVLAADERVYVEMVGATVGDFVEEVDLLYEPLTRTP